jgi:hypothetical protein
MKQLTFYGKKTVPSVIRKDTWRPFATVVFPIPKLPKAISMGENNLPLEEPDEDNELGLPTKQDYFITKLGQLAYKKLRELRLLRDYAWRKPGELIAVSDERRSGTAPPQEPRLANKRAHRRRESKIDWKERRQWLMDQRSTSVADLSTAIQQVNSFLQETLDAQNPEEKPLMDRKIFGEWRKVQALARRAGKGELVKVEDALRRAMDAASPNFRKKKRAVAAAKLEVKRLQARRELLVRSQLGVRWLKEKRKATRECEEMPSTPSSTDSAFATVTLDEKWTNLVEQMFSRLSQQDPQGQDVVASNEAMDTYPIRVFWANMFNRQFIADWPENTFHQEIGPRVNKDLYLGALPPLEPDELYNSAGAQEIDIEWRSPDRQEVQDLDKLKDLQMMESRVKMTLEDYENDVAQIVQEIDSLEHQKREPLEPEQMESNTVESLTEQQNDLRDQKVAIETEISTLEKLQERLQAEIDMLSPDVEEGRSSRSVQLTREIYRGNDGIDENIVVDYDPAEAVETGEIEAVV